MGRPVGREGRCCVSARAVKRIQASRKRGSGERFMSFITCWKCGRNEAKSGCVLFCSITSLNSFRPLSKSARSRMRPTTVKMSSWLETSNAGESPVAAVAESGRRGTDGESFRWVVKTPRLHDQGGSFVHQAGQRRSLISAICHCNPGVAILTSSFPSRKSLVKGLIAHRWSPPRDKAIESHALSRPGQWSRQASRARWLAAMLPFLVLGERAGKTTPLTVGHGSHR